MYKTIRNFISNNKVICKETFLLIYPAPLKLKKLNGEKKNLKSIKKKQEKEAKMKNK